MNAPLRHHALKAKPDARPISRRTARILRSHALHIQRLGRCVVGDIIEIGRRLHDAKRRAGHGNFLVWLGAEFGWSERTAENFMRVYDLHCKSEKFADLNLPLSALYLLAAPSTPDQALWEVAERAGQGAGLSIAEVKVIIANSRRASPLRHRIHLAKQILREVLDNTPCGVAGRICNPLDAEQIIDRRLAEYQRAGYDCEGVKYVLRHQCDERARTHIDQIARLKEEIKILDFVANHVRPPLERGR